ACRFEGSTARQKRALPSAPCGHALGSWPAVEAGLLPDAFGDAAQLVSFDGCLEHFRMMRLLSCAHLSAGLIPNMQSFLPGATGPSADLDTSDRSAHAGVHRALDSRR